MDKPSRSGTGSSLAFHPGSCSDIQCNLVVVAWVGECRELMPLQKKEIQSGWKL
ncbi:hypothetical protein M404DRAFT_1000573 [Pisolithus tinctorius Marx 270]|uniref:Uncharacterized protein n=1 Tax=Pisolithus tinctorius Marx 270 TaxID=870435 RepID=A0A0C3PA64_PISTI|nr:hypothetical protein M404DRAFT_1000573 [Pisolithus tinctorius Marx 270]